MMKDSIFKCDGGGCSAVRGESNHWYVSYKSTSKAFVVQPWDDCDAMVEDAIHLCGATCALKYFSLWLSGSRGAIGKTAPLEAVQP